MAAYQALIVEDQRDLARMIGAGLETLAHPFRVLDVPSAEEALLIAGRQRLDLLLIDVNLPGISGLELFRRLKASQPDMKTIIITGITEPGLRAQVAEAGAEAFLFKPVGLVEILAAVERVLGLQPLAPAQDQEEKPPDLAGRLTDLRHELGAIAALILNERGETLIQAGELPPELQELTLPPALVAAHGAAEKISLLLRMWPSRSLHFYSGKTADLYLGPLGQSHMLLVANPPATEGLPLERVGPLLRAAVDDFLHILETLGLPAEPAPEIQEAPTPEEALEEAPEVAEPEFEATLEHATEFPIESDEVDAFWDPKGERVDTGTLRHDSLSYEQARKLGLTPEDD
jgi:DNA-binding response OmpR family regulator